MLIEHKSGNPARRSADSAADLATEIREAVDEFKAEHTSELAKLRSELDVERTNREDLERKVNRARMTGDSPGPASPTAQWLDIKTGNLIPVLTHKQRIADLPEYRNDPGMSVGRFLRGIALGGKAPDAKQFIEQFKALGGNVDPAGGYLVPDALSARFVDLLRAQMVLSQAGVTTVPMPTRSLMIAKLTADPTCTWHGENAADITAADPSFGAINLHAKTVVCLVKFSIELAQDAANIEQLLEATMTQALAHKIDAAGLKGETTQAAAAPSGILNLASRNKVTGIGGPTSWDFLVDGIYELLADNVPRASIGPLVAHPALWKKMTKLKTGLASDNSPLPMPPDLADIGKLWSIAMPLNAGTGTAAIANWADVVFGSRAEITVQLLNQTFMGSNLQVALLAFARCDFGVVRSESLCSLEGITGL